MFLTSYTEPYYSAVYISLSVCLSISLFISLPRSLFLPLFVAGMRPTHVNYWPHIMINIDWTQCPRFPPDCAIEMLTTRQGWSLQPFLAWKPQWPPPVPVPPAPHTMLIVHMSRNTWGREVSPSEFPNKVFSSPRQMAFSLLFIRFAVMASGASGHTRGHTCTVAAPITPPHSPSVWNLALDHQRSALTVNSFTAC